jgi:hypothetical protein
MKKVGGRRPICFHTDKSLSIRRQEALDHEAAAPFHPIVPAVVRSDPLPHQASPKPQYTNDFADLATPSRCWDASQVGGSLERVSIK